MGKEVEVGGVGMRRGGIERWVDEGVGEYCE
jgi:hypothetical protein